MSNRRGRSRMRPYEPHVARQINANRHYGFAVGWARTAAEEPEARASAEAELRERLGDRLVGDVQWRVARNRVDAADLLRLLSLDHDADLGTIQQCSSLLNTYGGHIIVALAEGAPEKEPTP